MTDTPKTTTRERVVDLRKKGLTVKKIAKELGISTSNVGYHLTKAGLRKKIETNTAKSVKIAKPAETAKLSLVTKPLEDVEYQYLIDETNRLRTRLAQSRKLIRALIQQAGLDHD